MSLFRAASVTVSTSKAAEPEGDQSGPRLAALIEDLGAELVASELVADDQGAITDLLESLSARGCDLILTSGGTGVAPSDVTPEATRAAIEREAPGIAEALRLASREHTGNWMLSRGIAGIRGRTLIINFPGSPKSIDEAGEALRAALPHALALLRGEDTGHG